MSSPDLSSVLNSGVPLSELLAAAEVKPQDLSNEANKQRLAAWSMNQLVKFTKKANTIAKADAMAEWASICTPRFLLGLGAQWTIDKEVVNREIFILAQQPGWRRWAEGLTKMVRAESGRINTGKKKPSRLIPLAERLADSLGELAEELGLPDDIVCPVGFRVDAGGVWQIATDDDGNERTTNLCRVPILVTGLLRDVEGNGSSVLLRWRARGRWHQHVCGRKDVLVSRHLADLSAFDVPVSSSSAAGLVSWFEAFIIANEATLPMANTVAHMGWNEHGFQWGTNLISRDGTLMADPETGSWDAAPIHLDMAKPGLIQMAKGYGTSGTWDEWCAVVSRVRHHPRFGLALLASIAPCVLKILPEAPNFCLDFAGETSKGKTTALRLAASAWGSPSERDNGLVWSWDATQTWIERAASFVCDLPLILDDSKRAKVERVSSIVYSVAQGMGRGRATVQGLQVQTHWRTVLLSTGEAPLTHYATEGGASARILSVWGSPFSKHEPTTHGELARLTSRDTYRYYGHLGPRCVAMLHDPAVQSAMRELYDRSVEEYSAMLATHPVGPRIAQYLGVLACAEWLYVRTGAPQFVRSIIAEAYGAVSSSAVLADRATAAMHDVSAWVASSQGHFLGAPGVDAKSPPHAGWAGKWVGGDMWEKLAVIPDRLRDKLQSLGYDHAAIISTWKERGWIHSADSSVAVPTSFNGSTIRMIVIARRGKDEAEQRAKMNILEQVGEIVSDILEAKQEVLW
jgi:hypothetical protein